MGSYLLNFSLLTCLKMFKQVIFHMNNQAHQPTSSQRELILAINLARLYPGQTDAVTEACRLLSNPNRILILACLDPYDPTPYASIQDSTELSSSLLSQYLKQLINAGFILSWQDQRATPMYLLAKTQIQIYGDLPRGYDGHYVYPYI